MNYNSHPKMKYLYIGVDCHKYKHVATLKNCFNEKIITISFHNDKKGFEYLVKTVNEHKSDLIPIYGLEDTKHLGYELASYLLSRDQLVKNVNSNLTYVERKKNPVIIKNNGTPSVTKLFSNNLLQSIRLKQGFSTCKHTCVAITIKHATTLTKSTDISLCFFIVFCSTFRTNSCASFSFTFIFLHLNYFKNVSTFPFPFSDVIFSIAPFTIASCGDTCPISASHIIGIFKLPIASNTASLKSIS